MRRQVHTLRLSAPNEQMVHRGANLIEDALRIASLPDSRRLVLIRSLNLGKIDPSRSSAAVALRLEAELASQPMIYADSPGAANAPVVYFHDEIEPYVILIRRLLLGEAAEEWFWQSAIFNWRMLPRTAAAVTSLIEQVAVSQGAAAGVALLAEMNAQHVLPTLLDRLPLNSGIALLRAFGWLDIPSPDALTEPTVEPPWQIRRWVAAWGAESALTRWLVAVALAAQSPARLAYPSRLMAMAVQVAVTWTATPTTEPASHPDLVSDKSPRAKHTFRADISVAAVEQPTALPKTLANQVISEESDRVWSGGAGVVLTVNILQHLGIADVLTHSTTLRNCAFAERLLLHFADLIELAHNDPLREVFALPKDTLPAPETIEISHEFGGDEAQLVSWDAFLSEWDHEIQRWLDQYADMDFLELSARPGYLRTNRTHLDIFFSHEQADIRIRTAGIDINPGWTAWLGRLITFYYVSDPSTGEP